MWENPFLEFYGVDASDSVAKYLRLGNQVKEVNLFELEHHMRPSQVCPEWLGLATILLHTVGIHGHRRNKSVTPMHLKMAKEFCLFSCMSHVLPWNVAGRMNLFPRLFRSCSSWSRRANASTTW
jgi:hypothetical protein